MFHLQYRLAELKDIPEMAGLRSADRENEEHWKQRIMGYMNGEHHPQQALLPRIIYVATKEDIVVGFIAGHLTKRYECSGELQWMDVAIQHRRKGIATELLILLANWFVQKNGLRVCVNVDPTNNIAQRFYKHNGATDLNDHWLIWENINRVLKNG